MIELEVVDPRHRAEVIAERATGLESRTVRGKKMATTQSLFDEFSAALQFPLYFGENWDAFQECLSDPFPMWERGLHLTVTDPESVLCEEEDALVHVLFECLTEAARVLSSPVAVGEWWDRPEVDFRVLLLADAAHVDTAKRRWRL
ncbi:MAG: barstar family protein [Pseudolysinimonas sp.]